MDKLKLIFIGLGVIFTAILLYFAVTLVMGLFWYLVLFGVIALTGYGAYKFLSRPEKTTPQLERGTPEQELLNAQKTIDDYRRRITSGKE
ncbi:MAG: hypothetical protein ABI954_03550 [Pyrinomonadaceae bacterium]